MRKPPSSSEKDSGSLDRNLAYISANYAILLRAVEHEEIMIPVQMNILGSHPLGLCSWKDGARALPGSRSQAGAGHSWNTFNVFELGDVFRNSLRNSPLLCISDARLLLFKRKEDLLAIDTVYPQDEDQFIPRAYAVEWHIRYLEAEQRQFGTGNRPYGNMDTPRSGSPSSRQRRAGYWIQAFESSGQQIDTILLAHSSTSAQSRTRSSTGAARRRS
jgi:hypothetical protein